MKHGSIYPSKAIRFIMVALLVFALVFAPIRIIAEDVPSATPAPTIAPSAPPEQVSPTPPPSDPTPTLSPTTEPEALITPPQAEEPLQTSITPQPTIVSEVNTAESSSSSIAESITGDNSIATTTASQGAVITTGTAIAVAENIQIVNSDITNSQIAVPIIIVGSSTSQETIDLNTYWNNMQQGSEMSVPSNDQPAIVMNTADTTSQVSAIAQTGGNSITGPASQTVIITGDALAVAQLVSLINMDIQSSTIFNGSIIIFGQYSGDIIVPNISRFFEQNPSAISSIPHIIPIQENSGEANTTSSSTAVSGENTQMASAGEIKTGNASSQAVSQIYANSIIDSISKYEISINTLEVWKANNNVFGNDIITPLPYIKNIAKGESTVSALASTGNNTAEGVLSYIHTGSAFSLATTLEYINTQIHNSLIFHPIISVFGEWTGQLIEAKPDMTITLSEDRSAINSGDITTYSILVENRGHETARNVRGSVSLPNKERVIDGTTSFSLSRVGNGEKKVFSLRTILDSTSEKTLTTYAQVMTTDEEYSTANNQSSVTKDVIQPTVISQGDVSTQAEQEVDNRLPILLIHAKHNVGTHVLAGDIITYEIQIENIGEGTSYDTILIQEIFDAEYNMLTSQGIPFSTITPHSTKTVTFGLQLPQEIPPSFYSSRFAAEGFAANSTLAQSPPLTLPFSVGAREYYTQSNASVLGLQTVQKNPPKKQIHLAPSEKSNAITPIQLYMGVYVLLIILQQLGRFASHKLNDPTLTHPLS